MLKTHHDLPRAAREAMVELLGARLVDAINLGLQAKQAHWNVRGAHFLPLHELFDAVAAHAHGWADLLAERAGNLGGLVDGTAPAVATGSGLPAYPPDVTSGDEHVERMAGALAAFSAGVRAAIAKAEEADDAGTADALTEIVRAADQDLWFVEAHRQ
jgi:starvation-inducible DNA-binding protein